MSGWWRLIWKETLESTWGDLVWREVKQIFALFYWSIVSLIRVHSTWLFIIVKGIQGALEFVHGTDCIKCLFTVSGFSSQLQTKFIFPHSPVRMDMHVKVHFNLLWIWNTLYMYLFTFSRQKNLLCSQILDIMKNIFVQHYTDTQNTYKMYYIGIIIQWSEMV